MTEEVPGEPATKVSPCDANAAVTITNGPARVILFPLLHASLVAEECVVHGTITVDGLPTIDFEGVVDKVLNATGELEFECDHVVGVDQDARGLAILLEDGLAIAGVSGLQTGVGFVLRGPDAFMSLGCGPLVVPGVAEVDLNCTQGLIALEGVGALQSMVLDAAYECGVDPWTAI